MQRNLSLPITCPAQVENCILRWVATSVAIGLWDPSTDVTGVGIVRPEPVLGFGKLTSQGSLGQCLGILTTLSPTKIDSRFCCLLAITLGFSLLINEVEIFMLTSSGCDEPLICICCYYSHINWTANCCCMQIAFMLYFCVEENAWK